MDNAPKALVIAGGILIAVMIIGAALLMLNNAREFASAANTQAKAEAVQSFNRYYQSVVNSNGKIRGIDVLNVYHRAKDDREQPEKGYNITVNVNPSIIQALEAPTGAELMDKEFNYTITGYDVDGYITSITIS